MHKELLVSKYIPRWNIPRKNGPKILHTEDMLDTTKPTDNTHNNAHL